MELYFPAVLDGATGTELQKRGYTGGGCAEAWLLEHPDAILDVQRRYVDAGSDIIYTPTFGANRVKLEANGIFNRVEEFNLRLAALSKEAAAGRALVAGDIAPTGLFLAPLGTASFEELVEIYTEQAAALEKAGVDLFVIETMMTLPEARAALRAALADVVTAPPAPDFGGMIPCASEKDAFLLDPAAEMPEPFACDGELADNIEDAQDEGAETVAVRVETLADAEDFADAQYAVKVPLFIESADAAALEAALRAYQGRAIYSGPLADDVLVPLAEKYGLII